MFDYRQLDALATVIREGGFEKAARAMHLTQSAISQRVRALEEELGQVLLARTTPPGLTRAGKLLIRHVQEVERLESELLASVTPDREDASFAAVPIAVNADSMTTWFMDAVSDLIGQWRVALDIRPDDQQVTHRLLRNGEVMGCVSAKAGAAQGCSVEYLGRMDYRLLATPAFVATWFAGGVDAGALRRAPMVVFNRKDRLHEQLFRRVFRRARIEPPISYMPLQQSFFDMIAGGLAYGILPDQQSLELEARGALVDLLPGHVVPVDLHWHRWNLRSTLLDDLTAAIVTGARGALAQH